MFTSLFTKCNTVADYTARNYNDVVKWKLFLRYWPFVLGFHRWPVNSPHKGQWRGALMFSLICTWTNGWVNNLEAGDLRRHRAHYDVIVMLSHATYDHIQCVRETSFAADNVKNCSSSNGMFVNIELIADLVDNFLSSLANWWLGCIFSNILNVNSDWL